MLYATAYEMAVSKRIHDSDRVQTRAIQLNICVGLQINCAYIFRKDLIFKYSLYFLVICELQNCTPDLSVPRA